MPHIATCVSVDMQANFHIATCIVHAPHMHMHMHMHMHVHTFPVTRAEPTILLLVEMQALWGEP